MPYGHHVAKWKHWVDLYWKDWKQACFQFENCLLTSCTWCISFDQEFWHCHHHITTEESLRHVGERHHVHKRWSDILALSGHPPSKELLIQSVCLYHQCVVWLNVPSLIVFVVEKDDWIASDFHISFKQNVSRCLLRCPSLSFRSFCAQVTVTIKDNDAVFGIVACCIFYICITDLLINVILRPLHSMENMTPIKHKCWVCWNFRIDGHMFFVTRIFHYTCDVHEQHSWVYYSFLSTDSDGVGWSRYCDNLVLPTELDTFYQLTIDSPSSL